MDRWARDIGQVVVRSSSQGIQSGWPEGGSQSEQEVGKGDGQDQGGRHPTESARAQREDDGSPKSGVVGSSFPRHMGCSAFCGPKRPWNGRQGTSRVERFTSEPKTHSP